MKEPKFLKCEICGNIVGVINEGKGIIKCCGKDMVQLVANTSEGAGEKHLPVVSVDNDTVTVTVGSVEHPMTESHLIEWVYLLTDKGGHRARLTAESSPKVTFKLSDETPKKVYAYCNLHGLWSTDI